MILFLIITTSLTGSLLTHYIIRHFEMNPIKCSALLTLCFVLLTQSITYEHIGILQACFFGNSFIGMSDPKRLNYYQLSFASLIFAFSFFYFVSKQSGIGGTLGISAFLSCLVTIWIYKTSSRLTRRKRGLSEN